MSRIYLSPPDVGAGERELLLEAFESGWIAPLGPHVDGFEGEIADRTGREHAVATSSGTAALHLALSVCGVEAGDAVVCSDLTFVASANPIRYVGARPVFVGSEKTTWCMDADAFAEAIEAHKPKAAIVVDLYGHTPDYERIEKIAADSGTILIEDAAEALGSSHRGRPAGSFGKLAIISFNGNKIITTSGGGMLVGDDKSLLDRARHLATQAREPEVHYEHRDLGYNYRLSNLLAAVGRAQLARLDDIIARRREICALYATLFADSPGIDVQPEAPHTRSNRWLTCITVDANDFGASSSDIIERLAAENIEARPLWKPMHMQPLYAGETCVAPEVGADLFARGVCLPSGTALTNSDVERIASIINQVSRA